MKTRTRSFNKKITYCLCLVFVLLLLMPPVGVTAESTTFGGDRQAFEAGASVGKTLGYLIFPILFWVFFVRSLKKPKKTSRYVLLVLAILLTLYSIGSILRWLASFVPPMINV